MTANRKTANPGNRKFIATAWLHRQMDSFYRLPFAPIFQSTKCSRSGMQIAETRLKGQKQTILISNVFLAAAKADKGMRGGLYFLQMQFPRLNHLFSPESLLVCACRKSNSPTEMADYACSLVIFLDRAQWEFTHA
jgi:hypothetical protein